MVSILGARADAGYNAVSRFYSYRKHCELVGLREERKVHALIIESIITGGSVGGLPMPPRLVGRFRPKGRSLRRDRLFLVVVVRVS